MQGTAELAISASDAPVTTAASFAAPAPTAFQTSLVSDPSPEDVTETQAAQTSTQETVVEPQQPAEDPVAVDSFNFDSFNARTCATGPCPEDDPLTKVVEEIAKEMGPDGFWESKMPQEPESPDKPENEWFDA